MTNETMKTIPDEKGQGENSRPITEAPQTIRKVSKVVFDEATGTVTVTLATVEEIAEAGKMKGKD